MSETLMLTRREIASLMTDADWRIAVEAGFRAAAESRATAPPPMEIAGVGGAFHAKGAALQLDRHYVALKFNGHFPGNPGRRLPTIQGAILLCDGKAGTLLAVMDSIEVTLRRTAAATALAARYLGRPESQGLLVCRCGEQGRAQLRAIREALPVAQCLAWDRDFARARRFAREQGCDAVAKLPDGNGIDLIVTCTTATEPFLGPEHVAPRTFVAAVARTAPAKTRSSPRSSDLRWW